MVEVSTGRIMLFSLPRLVPAPRGAPRGSPSIHAIGARLWDESRYFSRGPPSGSRYFGYTLPPLLVLFLKISNPVGISYPFSYTTLPA